MTEYSKNVNSIERRRENMLYVGLTLWFSYKVEFTSNSKYHGGRVKIKFKIF